MDYIVLKDEMGIINYYNQNKELIMQVYNIFDENIRLYYQDGIIVNVSNDNITLELDYKGRILTGEFNNGLNCYFSYKHGKAVFLDYDGKYLGDLNLTLETINDSNRIYIVRKLFDKLEQFGKNLLTNRFHQEIDDIESKIDKVNNLMIDNVVSIINQDNRHSCNKILSDYQEREALEKQKLLRKNLSDEEYNLKYQKITRKYAYKRRKLKMEFNYANELKKYKAKAASLMFNQHRLNELITEKKQLKEEYLTRR